mmetsp:Transcript_9796/g.18541  ORF Transcript_9796/g.18541 Transcript_9796/m.18541 type:complete len:135 (-) Transcript_9796:117-521(-)
MSPRSLMTPVASAAVEAPPRARRRLWLRLSTRGSRRRRQRAAMPIPVGNDVNNFLMPDQLEDWPNFLVGVYFRPFPFPGHVEDSDRNNVLNVGKQVLRGLLPDGQPRRPQDDVAVGDAADEGFGDGHGLGVHGQ